MKFHQILAIILLSGAALSTVGPGRGLFHPTLLPQDAYGESMNMVFNLSEPNGGVIFKTNVGRVLGEGHPTQERHFGSYGVHQLDLVHPITDTLAAFVYDGTKVILEFLDHNGKAMIGSRLVDLTRFGTSSRCTGFAMNHQRGLLYIGCDDPGTQLSPGSIHITTIEMNDQQVVNSLVVPQDDGFRIVNRLEMFIADAPQDQGDNGQFLIVYDQGRSNQKVLTNGGAFRVFRNVDNRRLKYYFLGETEIRGHELEIMYDLFPYGQNLLLTGRFELSTSMITLARCKIMTSSRKLYCADTRDTLVEEGHISFQEGRYVEVNALTRTLTVNEIVGDFRLPSWNGKVIHHKEKLSLIDGLDFWIRGITVSDHGAIINYDQHGSHSEYGITVMSFFNDWCAVLKGTTGFIWEKNMVLGDISTSKVLLYRLVWGTLWIEGAEFEEEVNTLIVNATDSDGTTTATANVTIIDDIMELVAFDEIQPLSMVQGQQANLISRGTIKSGNGVHIKATSSDQDVVRVNVEQAVYMNVTWNTQTQPEGNFFFTGNMAVVETISHMGKALIYSTCTQTGVSVACTVLGTVQVTSSDFVHRRIIDLGNSTIAMYTTDKVTGYGTVHLMNAQGQFSRTFKRGIIDINGYTGNHHHGSTFLIAYKDSVEAYFVDVENLTQWTQRETVDKDFYGVDFFCPVAIRLDPIKLDRYDIFSHCLTNNHWTSYASIYRLSLHTHIHSLDHHVPLSNIDRPKDVCSFGLELLVSTDYRTYGVDIFDDWNYWSVPLTQMDIDRQTYHVDCVERLNTAVIWSTEESGGQNIKIWHVRGDSGPRQDRRYPLAWDIEAEVIEHFDFLGSIMSVLIQKGETHFVQSHVEPRVIVTAQNVSAESHAEVEITMENGSATANVVVPITVTPSGKVEVKSEKKLLRK